MKKYDILIIGGGIIGASIAYELAKYDVKVVLLEKNSVLADETSVGNSGLIHGGFDPEPHKIEAKLNLLGNNLWKEEIFPYLDFPHLDVPSIIIATNEHEMQHVHMLYERGIENNVRPEDMKVVAQAELRLLEPNVTPKAIGALVCYSSVAIDPVRATYAFIGAAKQNNLEVFLNSEVSKITKNEGTFQVFTKNSEIYESQIIINAAGHYADVIAKMANYPDFKLTTRRGQYRILHQDERAKVRNVVFKVPTIHGKGVIVAPTLDGKVLVGPTAEDNVPKNLTKIVTQEMWEHIGKIAHDINPSLDLSKTIKTLAGSRPIDIKTNDFIIQSAKKDPFFINVAGTQSPALSSAPAISKEVVKLIFKSGFEMADNIAFKPRYKVEF